MRVTPKGSLMMDARAGIIARGTFTRSRESHSPRFFSAPFISPRTMPISVTWASVALLPRSENSAASMAPSFSINMLRNPVSWVSRQDRFLVAPVSKVARRTDTAFAASVFVFSVVIDDILRSVDTVSGKDFFLNLAAITLGLGVAVHAARDGVFLLRGEHQAVTAPDGE